MAEGGRTSYIWGVRRIAFQISETRENSVLLLLSVISNAVTQLYTLCNILVSNASQSSFPLGCPTEITRFHT